MIDPFKEFSMERVHLKMLKIYGNNKHLYRIISWGFFFSVWYHEYLKYFCNFFVDLLIYQLCLILALQELHPRTWNAILEKAIMLILLLIYYDMGWYLFQRNTLFFAFI